MDQEDNRDRKILRNKMVGFMYLIFIVLAFIYIPSDFIDTIRYVNASLENSAREMNDARDYNIVLVKAGLKADSLGNEKNNTDYDKIFSLSDSVCNELEIVKQKVIEISGGVNKHGYFKNAKENQFTDKILLDQGAATQIRTMLIDYKTTIKTSGSTVSEAMLDSILPTQEIIKTSTGKDQTWEKFYFYKMPLSVSLALLSKFQNDVRKVEFMSIEDYLAEIKDNYDITLLDKHRILAEKTRPREERSRVIDPEAYIKNDALNVLYLDIDNQVKIYHPKVNINDITAEIPNGEIFKKGDIFYVRVKKAGIAEVNAFTKDNKSLLATNKFMVKSLPDPFLFIAGRKGGNISSKIFMIQKNIEVISEITDKEAYSIKSFSIIRISPDSELQRSKSNQGAYFNVATRELIDSAKRGDLFIFDNIEVEVPGGMIKTVPSLVFTIT